MIPASIPGGGHPTNSITYHSQHLPHGVPHLRKGRWSPAEDSRLLASIRVHGANKWKLVAQDVQTRSGDQCWKRWNDSLDPALNHQPWTSEEDQRLEASVEAMGRTWSKIAADYLNGRSGLACKNRMDHLMRKRRRASHSNALSGTKASANSLSLHAFINSRGSHNNHHGHSASFDSGIEGLASRHYGIQTGPTSSPKGDPYSFDGHLTGSSSNHNWGDNSGSTNGISSSQYLTASSPTPMGGHANAQNLSSFTQSNNAQTRHRYLHMANSAQTWSLASNNASVSSIGAGSTGGVAGANGGVASAYSSGSFSSAGVRQQLDNHASLYSSPHPNHQLYGQCNANPTSSNTSTWYGSSHNSAMTQNRSHGNYASYSDNSQTASSEANSAVHACSSTSASQSYTNNSSATLATTASSSSSCSAYPSASFSGLTASSSNGPSCASGQSYTSQPSVDASGASSGSTYQTYPTLSSGNGKPAMNYFGRGFGQQSGGHGGSSVCHASNSASLRQWGTTSSVEGARIAGSTINNRPTSGLSLYEGVASRVQSSNYNTYQQDSQSASSSRKENAPSTSTMLTSSPSHSNSQSSNGLWSSPHQSSRNSSQSSFNHGPGNLTPFLTPFGSCTNEHATNGAFPTHRYTSMNRAMGPMSSYRFGGFSSLGVPLHHHEINGSVSLLNSTQPTQHQQHAHTYDSPANETATIKKEHEDDGPTFSNRDVDSRVSISLASTSSEQSESLSSSGKTEDRFQRNTNLDRQQQQQQETEQALSHFCHLRAQRPPHEPDSTTTTTTTTTTTQVEEIDHNFHERKEEQRQRRQSQDGVEIEKHGESDNGSETSQTSVASFDLAAAATCSSYHLNPTRNECQGEKGSTDCQNFSQALDHEQASLATMTAVV